MTVTDEKFLSRISEFRSGVHSVAKKNGEWNLYSSATRRLVKHFDEENISRVPNFDQITWTITALYSSSLPELKASELTMEIGFLIYSFSPNCNISVQQRDCLISHGILWSHYGLHAKRTK